MEKGIAAAQAEIVGEGDAKRESADISAQNIALASQVLSYEELPSLDLLSMYDQHREAIKMETLALTVDHARVLYLTEAAMGDPDTDIHFLNRVVEEIPSFPEKPEVIVVSGIIAGDFKYRNKNMRELLVPGLKTQDQQFGSAKVVLDELADTGATVVYNLSGRDRAVAEDNNYSIFKRALKAAGKREQLDTPHWRLEQMKEHPMWDTHKAFQLNVAIPYCMRRGSALRSAEEMSQATNGEVRAEEYFILFEAHRRLNSDSDAPEDSFEEFEYKDLVEVDKLQNSERLVITDNVDLELDDGQRVYRTKIIDHLNLSNVTLYQDFMSRPIGAMAGRASGGVENPDMLALTANHEAIGALTRHTIIGAMPSLHDSTHLLDTKGSMTAAFTTARRAATTRGRIDTPGASQTEFTPDGRFLLSVMNRTLWDKSDSIADRIAIVVNSDWQTGSPTARPDYQVKWMDYVHRNILTEGKAAFAWTGDIIHGEIYPDHRHESQAVGLIAVESQKAFVHDMMHMVRSGLSREVLDNIMSEDFTPGNHEWHNGALKIHGDSFTSYLVDMSDDIFRANGLEPRAKLHDTITTPNGETFKSWTIMRQIGAYGIVARHFALDKMAGKGAGGKLPVYQANEQLTGARELAAGVDVHISGHWHNPQWATHADKLALVVGSLAGESGYEWERGYQPVIGATVLWLGGGLPPKVEYLSEQTLQRHQIADGPFSDAALNDEGYFDHPDFDVVAHGPMMHHELPKSALQRKIRDMMLGNSERIASTSTFPTGNVSSRLIVPQ